MINFTCGDTVFVNDRERRAGYVISNAQLLANSLMSVVLPAPISPWKRKIFWVEASWIICVAACGRLASDLTSIFMITILCREGLSPIHLFF